MIERNWRLFEFKNGERPRGEPPMWFWNVKCPEPDRIADNREVLLDLPWLVVKRFKRVTDGEHIQLYVKADLVQP